MQERSCIVHRVHTLKNRRWSKLIWSPTTTACLMIGSWFWHVRTPELIVIIFTVSQPCQLDVYLTDCCPKSRNDSFDGWRWIRRSCAENKILLINVYSLSLCVCVSCNAAPVSLVAIRGKTTDIACLLLRGTTRSLTGNKEGDTGLDRGASTFRDQRRSCGRGPLKAAARTVYRRHCEPSFASQKRPDWVLRLRKRSRKATWRQLEATRRDSLFDFTARDTFHLSHFFSSFFAIVVCTES